MTQFTDDDLFFDEIINEKCESLDEKDEETIKQHILDMLNGHCGKFQLELIANDLAQFYTSKKRHSYSQISSTIYQNIDNILLQNEDALDDLKNNCAEVCKIGMSGEVSADVKKGFAKFNDHVQLEITRISDQLRRNRQFNDMLEKSRMETEKQNEEALNNSLDEIKSTSHDVINKMNKINDNVFAQITSILGIFAAIIFVFFGGTQLFSNALNSIHEVKLAEVGILGFVVALIGMIMFDIIFMLLYVVSVISGKPLGGISAENTDNFSDKVKEKFPYVIWMNELLGAIMIGMLMLTKIFS